jgi:hypothetical protein
MGGGILPIAIHKGKLYFLFGKEVSNGQWGDFGGGREGTESQFQTAIREGCEELDGFLGCNSVLRKKITQNLVATITTESLQTFVFKIDYDENLPVYFNNHHFFIKKNLPKYVNKNGLFEKSQIKWFTVAELKNSRHRFRTFYRNVVDDILRNKQSLLKQAMKIK